MARNKGFRNIQVGMKLSSEEISTADELAKLLAKAYGVEVSRTDAVAYALKFTLEHKR